jgi:hypothetical protein
MIQQADTLASDLPQLTPPHSTLPYRLSKMTLTPRTSQNLSKECSDFQGVPTVGVFSEPLAIIPYFHPVLTLHH